KRGPAIGFQFRQFQEDGNVSKQGNQLYRPVCLSIGFSYWGGGPFPDRQGKFLRRVAPCQHEQALDSLRSRGSAANLRRRSQAASDRNRLFDRAEPVTDD